MRRLKWFLAVSLVILGTLIAVTIVRPMTVPDEYTQVAAQSLLATDGGWVLQFNIINHEGRDVSYTVQVSSGGTQSGDSFVVTDSGVYTYINHIATLDAGDGTLAVRIYRDGAENPIEQGTYYLK